MLNDKFETLIVGGGPAGLSTWLHLNKIDPEFVKNVLIIEKEKHPRQKICGGGLGAWSDIILKNLDVELDIPHINISHVEFIYRDDKYHLHQNNCFKMVKRSLFDYNLLRIAKKRGLKINENEEFIDFYCKNDNVIVKTNKSYYKVKCLIGADGSLSKVRKKMNLNNVPHLSPTLEVFAPNNPKFDQEYNLKKITIDLSCIDLNVQGYIWHVPTIIEDIAYIGHGMAHFRIHQHKSKPDMRKIFQEVLSERGIIQNQKYWLSHPIRWPSEKDIISKPNIFLIGDAVGIEPAFGGGIHFALSYGEIAAFTIIDAFENKNFTFKDYRKRFDSHLVGKFIKKCHRIASEMYDNRLYPLDGAKEVFTIKK